MPDIEDLLKYGQRTTSCPFYLSRESLRDADVIFLPYNYLLDLHTRRTLDGVRWDGAARAGGGGGRSLGARSIAFRPLRRPSSPPLPF